MVHSSDFFHRIVIEVCEVSGCAVGVMWTVVCQRPFDCIVVGDFGEKYEQFGFPEIRNVGCALSRLLGDDVAQFLEYFSGTLAEYSSAFQYEGLKVGVVLFFVGTGVISDFLGLLEFCCV